MRKRNLVLLIITVLAIIFCSCSGEEVEEESWTFISVPDWHTGDRELRHPRKPYSQEDVQLQLFTLQDMAAIDPELLLIAGDLCGGPWVGDAWVSIYGLDGTQENAIMNVGDIVYGNLKHRFTQFGFKHMLMAVGDHEIGEDSNWKPGSVASHMLPVYRETFQQNWNRVENGKFLYNEEIGQVASRPLGTVYENTSFAFKYKNILFVTVDIFRQPDPDQPTGYKAKSTEASMTGEHLKWFENVLKEADKDPDIKFKIVQAHTPVLSPVRGQRSSMLYVEEMENSTFWKTMEQNKVDVYFAGEVHSCSAQKLPGKWPVQVVHGDYSGRNYLQAKVTDHSLEFTIRLNDEGSFRSIGQMVIDKSEEETTIEDTGILKFIDVEQPLVHYNFEEIDGDQIVHTGQFAWFYNLQTDHATLEEGMIGQALKMDGEGMTESLGYGIMTMDHPSTSVLWVKTTQGGSSYLLSHGWGLSYDIVIKDGYLGVYGAPAIYTTGVETKINDGEWHQLAVVHTGKGKTLKDLKFYIDGKMEQTVSSGDDRLVNVIPSYKMTLGSPNLSENKWLKANGVRPFDGLIDEVKIWKKSLSPQDILNEYQEVVNQ